MKETKTYCDICGCESKNHDWQHKVAHDLKLYDLTHGPIVEFCNSCWKKYKKMLDKLKKEIRNG